MSNVIRVLIRLMSDSFDFSELKNQLSDYDVAYYKKNESVIKGKNDVSPLFRTTTNTFLIKNIFVAEELNYSLEQLKYIMDRIGMIIPEEQKDIQRQVKISARITTDQFGFDIDDSFIKLLAKHNYMLGFSSVIICD